MRVRILRAVMIVLHVAATMGVGACLRPMPRVPCGDLWCPEGYRCAPDSTCIASGVASSCSELGVDAVDQNVQLYLDGNPMQPYSAHCSADLKTYIALEGYNFSSYPLGGCSTPAASEQDGVKTTWQMIRFDTGVHAIDTGDYTFATSTGGTHETSGDGSVNNDYFKIPFGSGRSCSPAEVQTVAMVDLTGTHFMLEPSQIWSTDGFEAMTNAEIDSQRTMATITAQGNPTGVSPCAQYVDYYTLAGGTCLHLEYVP
jgi:hypothetical protein